MLPREKPAHDDMKTCKNCDFTFDGKFCPQCGQKAKTKRITMRQVLKDLQQHFIHVDQGFLYTIRQLLLRPGHSIREYIAGKRVRHVRPLKFVFWSVAISFLVFHYVGLDRDMAEKMVNQQTGSERARIMSEKIYQLITDHPTILLFFMIPMIALWSRALFRRKDYNYAEHFVLNAYLMGELSLASVLTAPLSKLISNVTTTTWPVTLSSLAIWVLYFGWAYVQFFEPSHKIWTGVKGALAIVLGYLTMILCMAVVMATIVVFFKAQLDNWLAN